MKILFTTLVFLLLTAPYASAQNLPSYPPLFPTEISAQQHCPSDVVVWVNNRSGVYHFKGQRWYGKTKNGSFACQKDAQKLGDRPTKNGQ